MRPSTVAELAGFGAIGAASWLISPIFGLFVAGFELLLIGYAFEDAQAAVAVQRLIEPLKRRRAARAVRRQERNARKAVAG